MGSVAIVDSGALSCFAALRHKGTRTRPPMGKLEQFLSQKRPKMYEACVEAGVIPKPKPAKNLE